MVRKCVVTGGPGVGKTTLVNELGRRGYPVVREAARLMNEMGIAVPRESEEVREFQMKVLEVQLELESEVAANDFAFLDRGIPDGIAYFWIHEVEPDPMLIRESLGSNYHRVFILTPLRKYEKDDVRWESAELALRLQGLTRRAYEFVGYSPIDVPAMGLDGRAKFVLDRI